MSDVNCEVKWEDVSTFNWDELHGKDVRVLVYEEEGVQISALYEPESDEFFIVSIREVGENE